MAEAEFDVAALAKLAGLEIAEEHRENVATQLSGLMVHARLVMDFPLPDEVEPAPVFRP